MQLLTVREAASLLRVTPLTIRRYVAAGKLPAVRIGRNVRIEQEAIERLVVPDTTSELQQDPVVGMGRELTADSPFWNLVGIVGDDDGPTDVAANHDAYLADAYADNHDK